MRLLFFIGHLLSIAVTADRMPGVSQRTSAWVAFICELFEDGHYFFGHNADHSHSFRDLLRERVSGGGHNHATDIPTVILNVCFYPLRKLAQGWHILAGPSRIELAGRPQAPAIIVDTSPAWKREQVLMELARGEKRLHSVAADIATAKIRVFQDLQNEVRVLPADVSPQSALERGKENPVLKQHRHTFFSIVPEEPTSSEECLARCLAVGA